MPSILGRKIKTLRENNKMTLESLAEKIDSTKSYVWELENSEAVRPSAEKIFAIARALDVTAEYLLDDKYNVKPKPSVKEEAFFRKYQQLDDDKKDQLKKFMDHFLDDGKK